MEGGHFLFKRFTKCSTIICAFLSYKLLNIIVKLIGFSVVIFSIFCCGEKKLFSQNTMNFWLNMHHNILIKSSLIYLYLSNLFFFLFSWYSANWKQFSNGILLRVLPIYRYHVINRTLKISQWKSLIKKGLCRRQTRH